MIFRETGRISDRLHVTGFAWSPSYLYDGERPVLFEAGFYCAGKLYERDIKSVLGSREPEMLFLTHVHYDHSGAAAYLKRAFPSMQVAASRKAQEIMKRPNAVSLMRKLSANMVSLAENIQGIDGDLLLRSPFEAFEVEVAVEDGQVIDIGGGERVEVIATPGHTADLMSYYIPGEKILFATEAAGLLWQNGSIGVEFLVDFDQYIESLKRLASLEVEILCQGHHFVFVGNEARDFFASSIEAAMRFRADVEGLLREKDGSVDKVVAAIKEKEYDTNPGVKQPEGAYLLNLRARVAHLAAKAGKGGG